MRASHKPTYTSGEQFYLDWYNTRVPAWLYCGLVLMCLVLGAYNFLDRAASSWPTQYYHSLHPPVAGTGRWYRSAILARWRKAAYKRNKVAGWFGMTSASQLIVIVLYALLNFLIAGLGARNEIDYQAHHCARLFNANLPLLAGLAAKELSFITWITGLSYETLNVFHRWTARLILILACVHIGGRTYVNVPPVDPSLPFSRYQAWGIASFAFFVLMIVGSARWVRIRWYTPFILSHVALFFLALITLSFHRPQVSAFCVVALVMYAFDRIVRGVSMIWYFVFKPVASGYGPSSVIEILSPDTLRLSVRTAKRWTPGQHTFVHAPLLGAGGHPFSIASNFLPITHTYPDPSPASATQIFIIRVRSGFTRRLYEYALTAVEQQKLSGAALSFSRFPTAPLWPCWIEGAYGHNLKLHRFERVLLITGGSGVSFALPLLLDLVRRIKDDRAGGKQMATKRLTWVWTIKDRSHVDWIEETLRDAVSFAAPGWLDVRIFVTGSANSKALPTIELGEELLGRWERGQDDFESFSYIPTDHAAELADSHPSATRRNVSSPFPPTPSAPTVPYFDDDESSFDTESTWSTTDHSGRPVTLRLHSGRPDVRAILNEVIDEADYADSVAVGTCGPLMLTRSVSDAVADAIDPQKVYKGEHRRNISLHLETFGW